MEPNEIEALWREVNADGNTVTYGEVLNLLEGISPNKQIHRKVVKTLEKFSKTPLGEIDEEVIAPPDMVFVVYGWYQDMKAKRDTIIARYNKRLSVKHSRNPDTLSKFEKIQVRAYIARHVKELMTAGKHNIDRWTEYRKFYME